MLRKAARRGLLDEARDDKRRAISVSPYGRENDLENITSTLLLGDAVQRDPLRLFHSGMWIGHHLGHPQFLFGAKGIQLDAAFAILQQQISLVSCRSSKLDQT